VISNTSNAMHRKMIRIDMRGCGDFQLELVGDLDDADHNLVRIAVAIHQVEFHRGIIFSEMIFNADDFVIEEVFFNLFPEYVQCVSKVNFERARVIS
jgi:hypothetical protein